MKAIGTIFGNIIGIILVGFVWIIAYAIASAIAGAAFDWQVAIILAIICIAIKGLVIIVKKGLKKS